MPTVLHIAPHPDDEALGACGTLLQLRGAGWTVVNLACSLGRTTQTSRRHAELVLACNRAEFELRQTVQTVAMSSEDDLLAAERQLAHEIEGLLRELSPKLVVGPSPHDAHHGHEVVGRATAKAISALSPVSRPRWWMWELWAALPTPTLYVAVPVPVLDHVQAVVGAHGGELERNDYRRALRARAEVAAVLGVERVFGWGSAGFGDRVAELFTEVLCDEADGWPLAAPRRLVLNDPLSGTARTCVDLGGWLAAPSVSASLFARDALVPRQDRHQA